MNPRNLFNYNPDTGELRWIKPNRRAGWKRRDGYVVVRHDGKNYLAHRLAWFVAYGEWPGVIDHINRNPSDNRLANLRAVTQRDNQRNQSLRVDSSTGIAGVSYDKSRGKYMAHINTGGKMVNLGRSSTLLDAAAKRISAANRLGYLAHC